MILAMSPEVRKWRLRCLPCYVVVLLVIIAWQQQLKFEGRPVRAIFRDLCLGTFVNHDVDRWQNASEAFKRMGSNVVPFLTFQLTNTEPQFSDLLLAKIRNLPGGTNLAGLEVPLSQKRAYAAVALRLMGTDGEASVPALVSIWNARDTNSRPGIVAALGSVLGLPMKDGYTVEEFTEYEDEVIRYARARFPEQFSTAPSRK